MSAGGSAEHEAVERARSYAQAAGRADTSLGRLVALETLGWKVLAGRRWAGSKRAAVDFILVGPGGVVVVDVKAWRALEVRDESVFCEDECRDGELTRLRSLTDRVEDSMSELGLTRQAIRPVMVFVGRRVSEHVQNVDLVGEDDLAVHVTRLGLRLTPEEVEEVAWVVDRDFPPQDPPPDRATRDGGVPESPFDVDELAAALLAAALAGPLETWMTLLHPDQLKLVSCTWSGPASVRGPVGTGKTVVGLHRAAYLAERSPRRVLFVTPARTLPVVLSALCERMAPHARANITFAGLHQLAFELLEAAGVRLPVDGAQAETAFARAWAARGRGSALTRLDARWTYWKEEVDHVIKGRGLTDFDEYAELDRVGRRTPMRHEHRVAMWELYLEYERLLDEAGARDVNDAIITARDLVRSGRVPHEFGPVVVDEVQDLDVVGLQLVHAIAGDGPDGLMVIGDGQQSVYPGGLTLAEAGIDVRGRAAVLRSNYRNAAEVLETASGVVAGDPFDDLEGTPDEEVQEFDTRRTGGITVTVRAPDQPDLDAALVLQIRAAHEAGVPLGDMAVLGFRPSDVAHFRGVLAREGLSTVDLLEYDGVSVDRLAVGTFKHAKGLEFGYVLLPGLRQGDLDEWSGESAESHRERVERMRRELFVGMTRARDGLWLGYLDAEPAGPLRTSFEKAQTPG